MDFPKHLVYTGNTLVLEPVNNSIRSMEQAEGGGIRRTRDYFPSSERLFWTDCQTIEMAVYSAMY